MSESQIGTVKVDVGSGPGDEYGLGAIANLAVGALRRSVTEHTFVDGHCAIHRLDGARAIVITVGGSNASNADWFRRLS